MASANPLTSFPRSKRLLYSVVAVVAAVVLVWIGRVTAPTAPSPSTVSPDAAPTLTGDRKAPPTSAASPDDAPNLTSDGVAASNTPRYSDMTLQRGTPQIDGQLNEWRLEDGFLTAPDRLRAPPPKGAMWTDKDEMDRLRQFYTVRGMMMEDLENLYIAATIGDPRGLFFQNTAVVKHLDEVDFPPSYLEVRVSSQFDGDDVTNKPQMNARGTTLLLSYSKNTHDAYLGIKRGTNENDTSQLPAITNRTVASGSDGFKCTFKQSGNDCVIEARIPWTLLQSRPSPENKQIRCIWQAFWKGDGQKPIRVVELVHPDHVVEVGGAVKVIGDSTDVWGAIIRR